MTKILKAPFPYFGGKSKVAAEVWRRFGKVKNYVEPFFGSGAVLLGRPDADERRVVETDNEHTMPDDWSVFAWKTQGGYANWSNGRGRDNKHRERIWFSPHCLSGTGDGGGLFVA